MSVRLIRIISLLSLLILGLVACGESPTTPKAGSTDTPTVSVTSGNTITTAVTTQPSGTLAAATPTVSTKDNNISLALAYSKDSKELLASFSITEVRALAFNPQSNLLAVGGNADVVTLLNAQTGEIAAKLPVKMKEVLALTFQPDSNILAVGGTGSLIQFLDVKTGEQVGEFDTRFTGKVVQIAFDQKAEKIAIRGITKMCACGPIADVYELANKKFAFGVVASSSFFFNDMTLDATGNYLAFGGVSSAGRSYIYLHKLGVKIPFDLYQIANLENLEREQDDFINAVAFSKDNKLAASHWLSAKELDEKVYVSVWSVESGQELLSLTDIPNRQFTIDWLAFHPTRDFLLGANLEKPDFATREDNSAIYIWNLQSGKLVYRTTPDQTKNLSAVTLSANGKFLATWQTQGALKVWLIK